MILPSGAYQRAMHITQSSIINSHLLCLNVYRNDEIFRNLLKDLNTQASIKPSLLFSVLVYFLLSNDLTIQNIFIFITAGDVP